MPFDFIFSVSLPNIGEHSGISFDQAHGLVGVVVTAACDCHSTAAFVVDMCAA